MKVVRWPEPLQQSWCVVRGARGWPFSARWKHPNGCMRKVCLVPQRQGEEEIPRQWEFCFVLFCFPVDKCKLLCHVWGDAQ